MSGAAASAGASKFQAFMNHPAGKPPHSAECLVQFAHSSPGPKTVFFWAPLMKWCLVGAGLKDMTRPADKLSVSQNLGAHGDILTTNCYSSVHKTQPWPLQGLSGFGIPL